MKAINDKEKPMDELTERIIGCAFRVSNVLGAGFLEKVYENALAVEMRGSGMKVEQQKPIQIFYGEHLVGDYVADLLVEESVLIELKVARAFDERHMAQALNYLKATGLKLCLLINFGRPRIEIKRIVNDL